MSPRLLVPALALFVLTGCRLPEDEWGIVRVIWNDFPWWSVVWRLALWTVLGVLVGVLVGVLASIFLYRWGAYRLPWPRVRFWLTVLIVATNLLATPTLFGSIGFLEGLCHSGEVALRHSVIGKEWLPQIAESGADALCFVDAFAENNQVRWEVIEKERPPLHVIRLLRNLDKIQGGVAEKATEKAKEHLFEENPEWKGGVAETVIDWTLPTILYYLLNHELQSRLSDYGVPNLLGDLKKEATKDGDEFLTHQELTAHLSERVMIPLILFPLKKWATGSQWSLLGIAAAVFATPPILLAIIRWITFWWKRRAIRRMCVDRM